MNDKIMDIHGHIPPKGHPASIHDMIASMRKNHIAKMFISSLGRDSWPAYPSAQEIRAANEDALAACRAYPDAFRAYIYLNPQLDNCLEEFNHWKDQPFVVGVKLWISLQDDQGTPARCLPVIRAAAAAGLPLLFHSFYRTGGTIEGELNPGQIAALAAQVPQSKSIIAHMGGNWTKTARAIAPYPNLYTDVSGGPPTRGAVETCVHILGAPRVLFGSDCVCRSIPSQLAKVLHADLSENEKTLILKDNAVSLFKERLQ